MIGQPWIRSSRRLATAPGGGGEVPVERWCLGIQGCATGRSSSQSSTASGESTTNQLRWGLKVQPGCDRVRELGGGPLLIAAVVDSGTSGPLRHPAYTDTSKYQLHGRLRLGFGNAAGTANETGLASAVLAVKPVGMWGGEPRRVPGARGRGPPASEGLRVPDVGRRRARRPPRGSGLGAAEAVLHLPPRRRSEARHRGLVRRRGRVGRARGPGRYGLALHDDQGHPQWGGGGALPGRPAGVRQGLHPPLGAQGERGGGVPRRPTHPVDWYDEPDGGGGEFPRPFLAAYSPGQKFSLHDDLHAMWLGKCLPIPPRGGAAGLGVHPAFLHPGHGVLLLQPRVQPPGLGPGRRRAPELRRGSPSARPTPTSPAPPSPSGSARRCGTATPASLHPRPALLPRAPTGRRNLSPTSS